MFWVTTTHYRSYDDPRVHRVDVGYVILKGDASWVGWVQRNWMGNRHTKQSHYLLQLNGDITLGTLGMIPTTSVGGGVLRPRLGVLGSRPVAHPRSGLWGPGREREMSRGRPESGWLMRGPRLGFGGHRYVAGLRLPGTGSRTELEV
jgi:hypothetical protein